MENEIQRAIDFLKNQIRWAFPVDEKYYDMAIATLERQKEVEQKRKEFRKAIEKAKQNFTPSESNEKETCEQYCGDCPHRICGKEKPREIAALQAEIAELRARIDKYAELPCKINPSGKQCRTCIWSGTHHLKTYGVWRCDYHGFYVDGNVPDNIHCEEWTKTESTFSELERGTDK